MLASSDSLAVEIGARLTIRDGERAIATAEVTRVVDREIAIARLTSGSLLDVALARVTVEVEPALAPVATLRVGVPAQGRASLLFACTAPGARSPASDTLYRREAIGPNQFRLVRSTFDRTSSWPETLLVRTFRDPADQEIALERGDLDIGVFWPGEVSTHLREHPEWRDFPLGTRSRGVVALSWTDLRGAAMPDPRSETDRAVLASVNREVFRDDLAPWSSSPASPDSLVSATRFEVDPSLPGRLRSSASCAGCRRNVRKRRRGARAGSTSTPPGRRSRRSPPRIPRGSSRRRFVRRSPAERSLQGSRSAVRPRGAGSPCVRRASRRRRLRRSRGLRELGSPQHGHDHGPEMNSLRFRLVLGSALIAVVPLAIAMVVLSRYLEEAVRAQAEQRLTATLGGLEAQLRSDGLRFEERLRILGKDPQLKRLYLVRSATTRDLSDYLAERRMLLGVDYLAVVDPGGPIVALASDGPTDPPPEAMGPPEPHGPIVTSLAPRPGLAMTATAPIVYEDRPVGTVRGGRLLDAEFLAPLEQSSGLKLVLRDAAGNVVATTLGGDPSGLERAAGVSRVSLDGRPYLGRDLPLRIGDPPWASVTGLVPTTAFERTLAALRITTMLLGSIGLATAVVLALLWSAQVSRPVEQLAAYSEKLATGEWDEPLRMQGVRELQTLVPGVRAHAIGPQVLPSSG